MLFGFKQPFISWEKRYMTTQTTGAKETTFESIYHTYTNIDCFVPCVTKSRRLDHWSTAHTDYIPQTK